LCFSIANSGKWNWTQLIPEQTQNDIYFIQANCAFSLLKLANEAKPNARTISKLDLRKSAGLPLPLDELA